MKRNFNTAKIAFSALFLILSFLYGRYAHSYSLLMYLTLAVSYGAITYFSGVSVIVVNTIASYLLTVFSIYLNTPGTEMFYEAFRMLLYVCPVSLFIGCGIRKKFDFYTIYTYSTLIVVLCIMAHMLKLVTIDNVNIVQSYIRGPLGLLTNSGYAITDIPFVANGQIDTSELINYFVNAVASSAPSVIIIFSMIATFVLIFLQKKVIKLVNKEETFPNIVSFSRLKLKRRTVLVLFLLYLFSMFASGTSGIVIGNIISVLLVMCMGCGMSLVDFYFKKAIGSSLLRLLIYITGFAFISIILTLFTFINPLMILALIGMIDASRDFRKIDKFDIKIIFR